MNESRSLREGGFFGKIKGTFTVLRSVPLVYYVVYYRQDVFGLSGRKLSEGGVECVHGLRVGVVVAEKLRRGHAEVFADVEKAGHGGEGVAVFYLIQVHRKDRCSHLHRKGLHSAHRLGMRQFLQGQLHRKAPRTCCDQDLYLQCYSQVLRKHDFLHGQSQNA